MKQIPLDIGPPPQPRFENFLAGPNAQALAHLGQLIPPSPPVFLWGPAGSGKTHLLRAHATRLQDAGEQLGWFEPGAALPWALAPGWALVVFDRCESLDEAEQHAAFALFVEAAAAGVQVAAAARLPPVDLPLRDDLRTRLAWGHVFAMQPLADAEARAVLRREADRRGLYFSDEVMQQLLTRFPRDLGHLMNLLDRLDHYGLAHSRRITVPMLRQMLSDELASDAVSPVAVSAA
jgi:DnaA family protein